MAILVNKTVLLDNITRTLGFNFAKVLEFIVEADPIKIPAINDIIFVIQTYIFSYIILYQF